MSISTPRAERQTGARLGTLLRQWRERALLTQEQLADRAALDVRTVRRLENSGVRQPRTTSIRQLAAALRLDGEERAMLAAAARGLPPPAGCDDPAPVAVPRQLPAGVAALAGGAGKARRRSRSTVMLVRARTRVAARIVAITHGEATADVELDAHGMRLVASITVAAVRELGLEEGAAVLMIQRGFRPQDGYRPPR